MTSQTTSELDAELRFMALATSTLEDEFGEIGYVFVVAQTKLKLSRNRHDGDTFVGIRTSGHDEPLFCCTLFGCKSLSVQEIGKAVVISLLSVSALDYRTRGTYQADTGLEITVHPFIQVRPYFRAEPADSSMQRIKAL
jgi:hypothetical protein